MTHRIKTLISYLFLIFLTADRFVLVSIYVPGCNKKAGAAAPAVNTIFDISTNGL
jgi:NADH:ubiquinone oxidoreductase subunit B-like Fe-S oxidoreductase